ncbi:hypothetical protein GTP46_24180 [Duganella sp. FT135W]|uniref:DUF3325 family protein n=1 Tax=Duganella flavida TaxID=2692175 RepID=A0A6L8KJ14_9BURK|nr:hypothetical protein [Duganella flavida]MYM25732.1 hypothetical protein [Duganella flavida]
MNWICTGVAALAALCLYLASPHQTLWKAALRRQAFLRWLSVPLLVGSVASAVETYGAWCGVCIALAGFMMALVSLPYLDAWRRKGGPHAR